MDMGFLDSPSLGVATVDTAKGGSMALAGGIDVGGTKIEAKLFDADWLVLDSRRIATPTSDYDSLVAAIEDQVGWLENLAQDRHIPIGVGVPGLVDRETGHMIIANLPVAGRNLEDDFSRHHGRNVPFVNDGRAFALSEAILGAGQGSFSVLGVVIGTGVSGGVVVDGRLLGQRNGAAGEFGHTPIPATVAADYDLPICACACGQSGCFETFVSGPGLSRLAKVVRGLNASPAEIAAGAAAGQDDFAEVMAIWTRLTGAMLRNALLTVDPDCIVLGGGVSKIEGIVDLLQAELPNGLLDGVHPPRIRLAEGGDSSGARGAAVMAMRAPGRG